MLATVPSPEKLDEKLDPRVKRTRGLIEQAFTDLLGEKDFQSITVQDITERAEVNRATFYAHFPDKYALLEHVIRQSFRQELKKRTLSACHFSDGNLQALLVTVCEFIAQSHARCKASENQFESLVETQVKQQIRELLERWLQEIGSEIDPQIAATATSWAIYGLALHWSRDKHHPSAEEYADQILPLIATNLRLKETSLLN
jgi:AcrR family transcriptional regulator